MDLDLNNFHPNMCQVAVLTRCALTTLLLINQGQDDEQKEIIDDLGRLLASAWELSAETADGSAEE